jgi:hypothetical protein
LRVLRQRPIDNFIVDFYCASLKLVIEIDGESHFTQQGKDYDEERTRILEGYGITVVRFTNVDVLQNFEGVCRELERWIPPPLGRGAFKRGFWLCEKRRSLCGKKGDGCLKERGDCYFEKRGDRLLL